MKTEAKQSNLTHGIVFPNIHAMMTGVWQVTRQENTVTAHYTDGTTESCEWPTVGYLGDHNPFSLVRTIQEKAREEES